MKPHIHTHNSASGAGTRSSVRGAMPYMTERQIQAYLMARDAIRRVRHASSSFDSYQGDMPHHYRAADGQHNSH